METYIFQRNKDGIYLLDLAKTWEKAMVAARVIAAVQYQCQKDVLVSLPASARRTQSRLILETAKRDFVVSAGQFLSVLTQFSPFLGRVLPPICPESHSQVRH